MYDRLQQDVIRYHVPDNCKNIDTFKDIFKHVKL